MERLGRLGFSGFGAEWIPDSDDRVIEVDEDAVGVMDCFGAFSEGWC